MGTTDLADVELRELARECGCTVLESTTAAGRPRLVLDCKTNESAICYLGGLARRDAQDPEVLALAAKLARDLRAELGREPSTAELATRVARFVRERVSFVREKDERFQPPLYTLELGQGDCDDHARMVAALLTAAGCDARIVGVANAQGNLSHVAAQVRDPRHASGWPFIETTINAGADYRPDNGAHYGEHPRAAALRLGAAKKRTDIA